MLCIMFMIFIAIGKYTDYKVECSSHHAENTFLCMRLNPRGLTPSETGMDDRYEDEKGQSNLHYVENNPVVFKTILSKKIYFVLIHIKFFLEFVPIFFP
jgi:hypothetical protein